MAFGSAKSFRYTYGLGDEWEHKIKVEKQLPPDPKLAHRAICVAGANARLPEDVGSVLRFAAFVEAMADPDHPDHQYMLDWHDRPLDPRTST